MKLRRQFYNMKDRQDLTGFKVSTLDNGFSRFVMDVSLSSIFLLLLSSNEFCRLRVDYSQHVMFFPLLIGRGEPAPGILHIFSPLLGLHSHHRDAPP